ncbi:MAG: hypothetical protein JNK79_06425 [Chitinophagaceae bacterium]|nr:hypothetical protein [Chitinophagaceae bacterium]
MRYQVVIDDDLKVVEEKINSDRFFNAEESQEQLGELFQRFLGANLYLKVYLDLLFASNQKIDSLNLRANREEAEKRLEADDELLKRLRDPAQRQEAIREWLASLPDREEFQRRLDAEGASIEEWCQEMDRRLHEIPLTVNKEVNAFHLRVKRLKRKVMGTKLIYVVMLIAIAVAIAVVLEELGLASFSNYFFLGLQTVIVFLLTEFVFNELAENAAKNKIRPELLETLALLKSKHVEYNNEIDNICAKYNIQRDHIFYLLDKLYDKLKSRKDGGGSPSL